MKRKNVVKKGAALLMAAATLAMSVLGVGAAPTDIIDMDATASMTIYKYDQTAAVEYGNVNLDQFVADGEEDMEAQEALADYALAGVEFTYLKVGDINTDSQAGSLRLLYDIPDELESILGLSNANNMYTSDELNAAMANTLVDNTAGKNKLENYVKKNGGTAMDVTDDSGMTTDYDLPLGLYLVVETRVPEEVHTTTDPFLVSLPQTDSAGDYWNYNVFVYPKNQTNVPTIDKLVSENGTYADIATASEGDVLDYRIVTKLPSITSEATYLTKYTFQDTLSKGIKYNKDTTISFYDNLDDAKNGTGMPVATWESGSNNFNATYDDVANTMSITMTENGLSVLNPGMTDKYLVVVYKATVQPDATVVLGDTGNPNDVTLTYSRTNTVEEETIADKANVYSFGINLKKNFSDNQGDTTAVQFVLKNETDGYYVTATGSNGVYYLTDTVHGTEEADGTVFSPAADGTMKINGLEADTYVLTEIHTDDGYSLLKEPMTIVINSTVDSITPSKATITGIDNPNVDVIVTAGDRASASVDGNATNMSEDGISTNGRVDMSVMNTRDFLLPQTGGLGTILFTVAGAALIVFAIVFIFARKKKDKEA